MRLKIFLVICILCITSSGSESDVKSKTKTIFRTAEDESSLNDYEERLNSQIDLIEKNLKIYIKRGVKNLLPTLMNYNGNSTLSKKCVGAFMKYIGGSTNVKHWALQMLDATSKLPSGLLEGTFSDFGAFDQCLNVEVLKRNGEMEFKGKYCAVEARPFMPPVPKNFSMSKQHHAGPMESIGQEMRIGGMVFFYLKFRFGVCIPSVCSLEDMQAVAKMAAEQIKVEVVIPKCYVKESVVFQPVHIVVIFILSLLLAICIAGSVVEYHAEKLHSTKQNTGLQILLCFSLISNYKRLISASKGSEELKALHGIKALSTGWLILGHTYVWTNFQLLRRPYVIPSIFTSLDFGIIMNGWLVVETFFFVSGLLTGYVVLKILPKTKGRINVPIFILRRYIRLTPGLLLVIGLAFFMPVVSSGPFWYERVDPELKACTLYWWTSILYISNWMGAQNICIHPTWYLSADFQLYAISIVFLYMLYRLPKIGVSLVVAFILVSIAVVGAITYASELPPIILISSGNSKQIQQTVDLVHMNTFTHAGPYYVGILIGYLLINYKDIKLSRTVNVCGWVVAPFLSLASVYGAHRWTIGEPHEPLLTAIYGAVHRTTFIMGVAWVAFVCINGHGGLVNKFLSSSILAPFGRLTYMIYLFHSIVAWVRIGSMRERNFSSRYNGIYEYAGNIFITVLFTIPLYLLLEAPLSNLERMLFSRIRLSNDIPPRSHPKSHPQTDIVMEPPIEDSKTKMEAVVSVDQISKPVELMSVKRLEKGCNNLAFHGNLYH